MASLTGQTVSGTYESLIKLADNTSFANGDNVELTDGRGNPIGISLQKSAGGGNIFVTIEAQYLQKGQNFVSSSFNLNDFQNGTGDDEFLQPTSSLIEAIVDLLANLNSGTTTVRTLNDMFGNIDFINGTNTTVVVDTNAKTIQINAAGSGGGAVDSVNSLTGAIDIVSTDLDLLTVSTNGQDIELNPILPRTMLEDIINVSGGTIQKGQALHITGSNGNAAEVVLADSSLGLAAHLICFSNTIADGDPGKAVAVGFIGNVSVADTTNFQPGTHVYLSTGGGFTHIRPTGTNIVQYLGVVLNASTTSGAGTISGIIQNLGEENSLPNLQQNYVWEGNLNGVPQAVHQNTLSVASAVNATNAQTAVSAQDAQYADEAADVKIDAVTSGTFRVILGDDGQASGAYQRLKSDVANGFTYNASGDVVSAGAFTATNNVTAGGALSGASLDISGNAGIDGNLTLGGIGNVENEINQNTSDIAALQAIPQVAPVVNISTDITIDDDTYSNKFVVSSSGSEITLDNIQAWQPTVGTEIYFMSTSGSVSIIGNPTLLYPPGKTEFSRGTNSVIGIKCIDAGNPGTSTEATWVIFGDLT